MNVNDAFTIVFFISILATGLFFCLSLYFWWILVLLTVTIEVLSRTFPWSTQFSLLMFYILRLRVIRDIRRMYLCYFLFSFFLFIIGVAWILFSRLVLKEHL